MAKKITQSGQARAWQRMLSGRRLDLLDPSPFDIEIEDIAHGLARVARWNGQTTGDHAFSVAQHSLLVDAILTSWQPDCSTDERIAALLHDASEYVIGDMISPFKAVIGEQYRKTEERLENAIHMRFGLPAEQKAGVKKRIKKADRASAYFEAITMAGFSEEEAGQLFSKPKDVSIHQFAHYLIPWSTLEAQQNFINHFFGLDAERNA